MLHIANKTSLLKFRIVIVVFATSRNFIMLDFQYNENTTSHEHTSNNRFG